MLRLLAAILLASAIAHAQVGLEGTWQGELSVGAMSLRLIFKFNKQPDGLWKAILDSPDQGINDIPAVVAAFDGEQLSVTVESVRGSYEGNLAKDGAEIKGKWSQSGMSLPLNLKRAKGPIATARPQDPVKPYPYDEEDVTFENTKAGITLAGTLTKPRGVKESPAVVLVSGSGPQDRNEALMGHRPFLVLADYLTRRGIAVLRYDDRGAFKSTGNFASATTKDFADDALAAVEFLKKRPDILPNEIGLIGHSEGGLIAPLCAAKSHDVAFIVLMAGPGVPGEQILLLQAELIARAMGVPEKEVKLTKEVQTKMFRAIHRGGTDKQVEKRVLAVVKKEYAKFPKRDRDAAGSPENAAQTILTPWFRFFLTYDPRPTLRKVSCPVLAVAGERDLQVPPKQNLPEIAKALKAGGNDDFTIKLLPKLNHLFQTCKTGAPSEYNKIDETIAPIALQEIGDWIVKRTSIAK